MASDAGQDRAVLEALLSGSHEGASGARSTSSSLPIQSSMLEDHTRLGPYEVLEPLGRGGMGVVYRARHEESGKEVALKTVAVERASTLAALRRECAALAEIQHPGIARMVDNGMSDAPPWYAMALIEGRSLRARMGASRPEPDPVEEPLDETPSGRWWKSELSETLEDADLDPLGGSIEQAVDPALLGVLAELCRTLAWLHGEGFVHGDLKPENVVVTPQGRPVILDFGLAMRAHVGMSREQLEWRTNMAGTLAYMSPEQTLGRELDARSDLYAIGCILYEVVVGEPPFTGFTAEDIIAWSREHMANYKAPRRIVFVDALPRNALGKVTRFVLREQLTAD